MEERTSKKKETVDSRFLLIYAFKMLTIKQKDNIECWIDNTRVIIVWSCKTLTVLAAIKWNVILYASNSSGGGSGSSFVVSGHL